MTAWGVSGMSFLLAALYPRCSQRASAEGARARNRRARPGVESSRTGLMTDDQRVRISEDEVGHEVSADNATVAAQLSAGGYRNAGFPRDADAPGAHRPGSDDHARGHVDRVVCRGTRALPGLSPCRAELASRRAGRRELAQ